MPDLSTTEDPGTVPGQLTLDQALSEVESLARWLDKLGQSSLRDPAAKEKVMVPNAARAARILRVLFPAQGRA